MLFFEAACVGDVRHRISVEISFFELTIMKMFDFNHYWYFQMWNFAVISQNTGKIPPDSLVASVCLFDKAVLKRFSPTQNFLIFSKIKDGLSTDFSKFLENWSLIKHGNF